MQPMMNVTVFMIVLAFFSDALGMQGLMKSSKIVPESEFKHEDILKTT
jgi:hypothetical protein